MPYRGLEVCRRLLGLMIAMWSISESCVAQGKRDFAQAATRNAAPGEIIRVWPLEGGATPGAKAYRILYGSTGLRGEPIAVSAAVVFPDGPAPANGRPVVAWAHPTSGIATKCAPSLFPNNQNSIIGLAEMMRRGYVVVATDYPGLGSPGMHPYLVGESEAKSVLDSVRAVRNLSNAKAQDQFAVWGHSQGGHAALFTGQLAASYAPELKLVGVAAAAPATYLSALFERDRDTSSGRAYTAMTLKSWSTIYGLPLDDLLQSNATGAYRRIVGDCIRSISEMLKQEKDVALLRRTFLKADPSKMPAWREIMERNTPGETAAGAPVFLSQGTADTTVPPALTARFFEQLCAGATPVRYVVKQGVTHVYIAIQSAFDAVAWMANRFAGEAAPNDCKG